jgi:hypothetical protein
LVLAEFEEEMKALVLDGVRGFGLCETDYLLATLRVLVLPKGPCRIMVGNHDAKRHEKEARSSKKQAF